jgi:multidrug resistance efflux pump
MSDPLTHDEQELQGAMSVITIRDNDRQTADKELGASRVDWRRLRRLALHVGLVAFAVAGTAFYMNSGFSGLLLRADGHVTRERLAVAPAFEGRVAEMLVRPGDHVTKGQKIAVVKSVAVGRSLADLEAEKARLTSKIAELVTRQRVIFETLPLAVSSAERAAAYLRDLDHAEASGLAVRRSLQEMTAASLAAAEHVASLRAQQDSLSAELDANRTAFERATSAYNELSATYADGALYASVSGEVGANVAAVGQALAMGSGAVADIFAGRSFVLAYLPDSYLFDISEGQPVAIKTRTETVDGRIDRILPLAQNLPNDLQLPNRQLERGRLVRIALPTGSALPIDQRVRVAGCFLNRCDESLLHSILADTSSAVGRLGDVVIGLGTKARNLVERLASAQPPGETL